MAGDWVEAIVSTLIVALMILAVYIILGCAYNNSLAEEVDIKVSPPSRVQVCAHLQNTNRHREWAECMGVGYKS